MSGVSRVPAPSRKSGSSAAIAATAPLGRRGAEGDLEDRQARLGQRAGQRHGVGRVLDLHHGHDGERLDPVEQLVPGHAATSR